MLNFIISTVNLIISFIYLLFWIITGISRKDIFNISGILAIFNNNVLFDVRNIHWIILSLSVSAVPILSVLTVLSSACILLFLKLHREEKGIRVASIFVTVAVFWQTIVLMMFYLS